MMVFDGLLVMVGCVCVCVCVCVHTHISIFSKRERRNLGVKTEKEGRWKTGNTMGGIPQAGSEQGLMLLGTEPQVKAEVAILMENPVRLKVTTPRLLLENSGGKVKKLCDGGGYFPFLGRRTPAGVS